MEANKGLHGDWRYSLKIWTAWLFMCSSGCLASCLSNLSVVGGPMERAVRLAKATVTPGAWDLWCLHSSRLQGRRDEDLRAFKHRPWCVQMGSTPTDKHEACFLFNILWFITLQSCYMLVKPKKALFKPRRNNTIQVFWETFKASSPYKLKTATTVNCEWHFS